MNSEGIYLWYTTGIPGIYTHTQQRGAICIPAGIPVSYQVLVWMGMPGCARQI